MAHSADDARRRSRGVTGKAGLNEQATTLRELRADSQNAPAPGGVGQAQELERAFDPELWRHAQAEQDAEELAKASPVPVVFPVFE